MVQRYFVKAGSRMNTNIKIRMATLKRQNILNLNACIAYTPTENAYLTNASIYFHESLEYKKVGHFTKCGYKFGTWYDVIWMEKIIGDHSANPKPVIPISELYELQL